MNRSSLSPEWSSGDAYDRYMGRWSRVVARMFLTWLGLPERRRWLDVGCGTGALSQTILALAAPSHVQGLDPSEGFIRHARIQTQDLRVAFSVGDAQTLPFETASFDVTVSGLALNFIPNPARALSEMVRVTRPEGKVAIYVWDYAGGMELMRAFWDAAVALDLEARSLSETLRVSLGNEQALRERFHRAGLSHVDSQRLEIPLRFADFDDYWLPFLGGQGTAPAYAMSLNETRREALREHIRSSLSMTGDGGIELRASAWAVRGEVKS